MKREAEDGYALVAAVASIAVFAAMALTLLSATRIGIVESGAEQAQLQAQASVDAGVAMALSGLLSADAGQRWPIGQGWRQLRYGNAELRVRIEDERGKVPISQIDEARATRLLEAAGLSGDRLLIARDSLLDWTDTDDEPRPFGAERDYYRAAGIVPANGFLASTGEARGIRGFDAGVVARIEPIVTTHIAAASFDLRYADPEAIAIMGDSGGAGGPAAIDRARELQGQRTAIGFTDTTSLTGRPLTIHVEATLPDGARAVRRTVIELTGVASRPYVVRASD